jgi:hypothetical protein
MLQAAETKYLEKFPQAARTDEIDPDRLSLELLHNKYKVAPGFAGMRHLLASTAMLYLHQNDQRPADPRLSSVKALRTEGFGEAIKQDITYADVTAQWKKRKTSLRQWIGYRLFARARVCSCVCFDFGELVTLMLQVLVYASHLLILLGSIADVFSSNRGREWGEG